MRYPKFDPTLTDRVGKSESAFAVSGEVAELKKNGKDIIEFHIGQPKEKTPKNICEKAKWATDNGYHGYTVPLGIPPAKEAIARYFTRTRHIDVRPENVSIENGAKIYINHMISAVTKHGRGEVIYFVPGYPIYDERVDTLGAIPRPIFLYEKNGFVFDVDELGRTINPDTRLIILNFPQNPCGSVPTRYELSAVSKIIRKYPNLYVLSDEVYNAFSYDAEFLSIASFPGMQERTVIMDGLSKTYAMTGWRIGFATGNEKIIASFGKQTTNLSGCANHMTQWAIVEALDGPQDEITARIQAYKERRDLVVQLLNEVPGVTCLVPGGAFYVYPNITEACKIVGAKSSEEFRKKLLNEAGVSITVDTHFGPKVPGDGHHGRLSYVVSKEEIIEGVGRRTKSWVESHIK